MLTFELVSGLLQLTANQIVHRYPSSFLQIEFPFEKKNSSIFLLSFFTPVHLKSSTRGMRGGEL